MNAIILGLWNVSGRRWIVSDAGHDFKTDDADVAVATFLKLWNDGARGIEIRHYPGPGPMHVDEIRSTDPGEVKCCGCHKSIYGFLGISNDQLEFTAGFWYVGEHSEAAFCNACYVLHQPENQPC